MKPGQAVRVEAVFRNYAGCPVLDLGTSRGYIAAILASAGCFVTTVDKEDRGARGNLDGLSADVVRADFIQYLESTSKEFDAIIIDKHGNERPVWEKLWPLITGHLRRGGQALIYNSHLSDLPEWRDQDGPQWVVTTQLGGWTTETYPDPSPGMVVATKP
jgi:protein-L-isoaspartate O-methyltransferase